MNLTDLVILAIIQGITEFLPISSSGHLALWPLLTGRTDQGAVMDVAVHVGTLAAVCVYFRAEFAKLVIGTGHILTARIGTPEARLAGLIALATVPAVIAGLALKLADGQGALRTVEVIGWATVLGAVLLWAADRSVPRRGPAESWSARDAVLMGLAQALALIPGTSRSGITMTAARVLGFDRAQSARLALMMAIPVILAAGAVESIDVFRAGDATVGLDLLLGGALSFGAALLALNVMMRMFSHEWTMLPFVLYRLGLGAVLLWLSYA